MGFPAVIPACCKSLTVETVAKPISLARRASEGRPSLARLRVGLTARVLKQSVILFVAAFPRCTIEPANSPNSGSCLNQRGKTHAATQQFKLS